MSKLNTKDLLLLFCCFLAFTSNAQLDGQLSGSFQSESQFYRDDEDILALVPEEKIGSNNYLKIDYSIGDFSMGIRYEGYFPRLQGYPDDYKGTGIANRFATYKGGLLEVTAGNFYEQFGAGLILRAFEERLLGIDNSLDGMRVVIKPYQGVNLKLLFGRQRNFFEYGEGTVRGLDGDFSLNEILMNEWPLRVRLAGSFVSKYEQYTGPDEDIPKEVNSYSGRLYVNADKFNFEVEYVDLGSNPSSDNNFSLRKGNALISSIGYYTHGLSASFDFRRVDNMSFRSERLHEDLTVQNLWVNFIPALTKQQEYLLANIYPYPAQANGEIAFQSNWAYTIPKGTALGGKYGTKLAFNYSQTTALKYDTLNSMEEDPGPEFWGFGKELFYRDISLQLKKKLSKKLKATATVIHTEYNKQRLESGAVTPNVKSLILVGEVQYKMKNKKSLRAELQHLSTKEDKKNWMAWVLEFNVAPNWSFFMSDQYNYGSDDQIHYYQGGLSYSKSSTRIALNFGRQRGGFMCLGGVCRMVPAASGLGLSISKSF